MSSALLDIPESRDWPEGTRPCIGDRSLVVDAESVVFSCYSAGNVIRAVSGIPSTKADIATIEKYISEQAHLSTQIDQPELTSEIIVGIVRRKVIEVTRYRQESPCRRLARWFLVGSSGKVCDEYYCARCNRAVLDNVCMHELSDQVLVQKEK